MHRIPRSSEAFFWISNIVSTRASRRWSRTFSRSSYTYQQFKDAVEQAFITEFGSSRVTRGNKALDVHANIYRVDADVVPCFEHRRYTARRAYGSFYYLSGTELRQNRRARVEAPWFG